MMNKNLIYETFDEVTNKQIFFKTIFIEINYPFSVVNFDQEDFELATKITALKFLGGFNYVTDESRIVYLNKIKIQNNDLFIWENNQKLKIFIEKFKNKIEKKNTFTVKIKNIEDLDYIKHLVTYEQFKSI